MSRPKVIAIDGPAASGKSSVARLLAQHLGFRYINTGNMYRAATWHALQSGIDPHKAEAVATLLRHARIECPFEGSTSTIRIDGADPSDKLSSDEVNRAVSLVAAIPAVRSLLVDLQRNLASDADVVMEGRDIGSVVFPDTPFKLYIDASPDIRSARRAAQGLTDEIARRDAVDSSRPTSPLTTAPDAAVIDTSHLSLDQVVDAALAILAAKGLPMP